MVCLQRWCSYFSGKEGWAFEALRDWLAPAACWASWADCLSQVNARALQVCAQLVEELPLSRVQCVREAQDAAILLAHEGMEVLEWSRFPVAEFRAPQPVDTEVGEWTRGWQFHASVARDSHFATRVHLPVATDLGQTDFGHPCWTDFGQNWCFSVWGEKNRHWPNHWCLGRHKKTRQKGGGKNNIVRVFW